MVVITMDSLFSSTFQEYVFLSVFLLWFLGEIIGSRIMPNLRGGNRLMKRRDKGSGLLIYASVSVTIVVAFLLTADRLFLLPNWFFFLGITLMLFGIFLRQWSIVILGRFFSTSIGVQKDQHVVDYGPYRYIRHPSYLGALLTFLGIGFSLASWGAVLLFFMMFIIVYGYRISIEEKVLATELGDNYSQYMKRTKRLIPFIFGLFL